MRGWHLAGGLVAMLCMVAAPSRAQEPQADSQAAPETTAAARALFEQGMAAVDARDFETAADRLERSLSLRDSPVVRTNYALALIELGRLVEASEHLRTVQRSVPGDSRVHQIASQTLASIEPRLGRLRVEVTGATENVQVRLDDQPMAPALVGVEQPIDPGAHRVSLHRGDVELASSSVSVDAGRSTSIRLEARPPTPEEVAAQSWVGEDDLLPGTRVDEGGIEREWWFWTLIAVVLVGAGVAIGVAVATGGGQEAPIPGDSGLVHPTLVEFP